MVALRNPTKRPVTVVLANPDAPRSDLVVSQVLLDPRSGETAQRRMQLRVPDSLVLRPGELRTDLPDYVREDALRAGLELVEDAPKEPERTAEEQNAEAPADDKPRERQRTERRKGAS